MIFSYIFYKIETISSTYSDNEIILNFNNSQNERSSNSILNFLFIITAYIFIEYLARIFSSLGLMIFDYWMFELLIISYINAKMLKLKIYRHQMFAILFNSFVCLLFRIPYFILSFSLKKDGRSLLNQSNWYWYFVLGLFIYVIIITIRACSYTKIKWIIDLKYISPTKLLIYIGFIGILISSISCIIETNIKFKIEILSISFCESLKINII